WSLEGSRKSRNFAEGTAFVTVGSASRRRSAPFWGLSRPVIRTRGPSEGKGSTNFPALLFAASAEDPVMLSSLSGVLRSAIALVSSTLLRSQRLIEPTAGWG